MNILEVWAAFAIVCIGSIEEKLSFIFDLFDFNHQKSISHTEVMVLFGTGRLYGHHEIRAARRTS